VQTSLWTLIERYTKQYHVNNSHLWLIVRALLHLSPFGRKVFVTIKDTTGGLSGGRNCGFLTSKLGISHSRPVNSSMIPEKSLYVCTADNSDYKIQTLSSTAVCKGSNTGQVGLTSDTVCHTSVIQYKNNQALIPYIQPLLQVSNQGYSYIFSKVFVLKDLLTLEWQTPTCNFTVYIQGVSRL
jgi:hypothetical protein